MVLGKDGGVLEPFVTLARFGLCGRQGSGKQYISWMHEIDFVRSIQFAIAQNVEGIYNCTAPEPVTNTAFTKAVRQSMRIPIGIPAPALFVKVGGALIGTEGELLLTGRRVVPAKLLRERFEFRYDNIDAALHNIFAA